MPIQGDTARRCPHKRLLRASLRGLPGMIAKFFFVRQRQLASLFTMYYIEKENKRWKGWWTMAEQEKVGFFFYSNWFYDAQDLKPAQRLIWYESIIKYALTGKEPELPPRLEFAFKMIIPNIDKKEKISKIRSESGKKGGAPKGNQNAKKQARQEKSSKNNQNNLDSNNESIYDKDFFSKEKKDKDSVSEVGALTAPPPPRITEEEIEHAQSSLPPAPIGVDGKPDYKAQGMEFARELERRSRQPK